ncbi:cytochrome P450 [Russula vinacea]|nr:cytochrome P450 [Russula vinacea]
MILDNLPQLPIPRGALITTLIIILAVRYVRSPWRKVPPGPMGLPILGNALQLHDKAWMFEKDSKQKYKISDHMMYLNALGQSILVINSLKTAYQLLDRRANIYSGRPRFIVAHETFCGGLLMVFMQCGDLLRRYRRASHEMLSKVAVRDYHPVFRKEAVLLSSAILKSPDTLDKHFERASASATMSMLYDYPTLEDEHDKTLTEVHAFLDRMSAASAPGAHLVEIFHWMIHIPERFAKWKREGVEYFKQHSAMFSGLLDAVSKDIAKGSERPSVSASLIKNSNRNGLSNTDIAWLAGALYAAGSETTASTLAWWTRAMVAHPEIQKRAQDELDTVVGRSRTPTFADAPNLPYIQALVKESLRWRPVLPLGIPHTTTEDDWYEGMFIPKGTLCMVNLWQCHRSFRAWETRDDGHSSYGFGRRLCVGKHAANDSMFIDIATVLWAAQLEHTRDTSGKEVPLDTETYVDTGVIFKPLPYECKITPRFPEAPSILSEELELLKT